LAGDADRRVARAASDRCTDLAYDVLRREVVHREARAVDVEHQFGRLVALEHAARSVRVDIADARVRLESGGEVFSDLAYPLVVVAEDLDAVVRRRAAAAVERRTVAVHADLGTAVADRVLVQLLLDRDGDVRVLVLLLEVDADRR